MFNASKSDITLASLKGITIRVTVTRSLTVRIWIAIQLHKLAAWVVGADVRIQEDHEVKRRKL